MAERYSLGPLHLLPPGEGRNFKVGDRKVAVFRTRDGGVFATQASCPHRAGPLADGLLGGHALVCPLHEWLFDLKTGSSLNGNCNIKTYSASVEPDGTVMVEVDDGEEVMAMPDAGTMAKRYRHGDFAAGVGSAATGADTVPTALSVDWSGALNVGLKRPDLRQRAFARGCFCRSGLFSPTSLPELTGQP